MVSMMDKLGLLSLQVPILATGTESTDGTSSLYFAAAEGLPTRYVSPHADAAGVSVSAIGLASGEASKRGGGKLAAAAAACGDSSSSFPAAAESSSSSSCYWDDLTTSDECSSYHGGAVADTAANKEGGGEIGGGGKMACWPASSDASCALRVKTKRSAAVVAAPPCPPSASERQHEVPQRQVGTRPPEQQQLLLQRRGEMGRAPASAAAGAAEQLEVGAAEKSGERGTWRQPVRTSRDSEGKADRQKVKDEFVTTDAAAASLGRRCLEVSRIPRSHSQLPTTENTMILMNSLDAAAGKEAKREAAAAAPDAAALEAVLCRAAKEAGDDLEASQADGAGAAGSPCSEVKGGGGEGAAAADENVGGTGTPTTRFSTEQEEEVAALPADPCRDSASAAGAAASSGRVAAEEGGAPCSSLERAAVHSNSSENLPLSPSYNKRPLSSAELQFDAAGAAAAGAAAAGAAAAGAAAGGAAAAGAERDSAEQKIRRHPSSGQSGDSSSSSSTSRWRHGQQHQQHFGADDDAPLQEGEASLLRDGGPVGDLLAAAAVVVEQQVYALSAGGSGAAASSSPRSRRARSEETRVSAVARATAHRESAEKTSAAAALLASGAARQSHSATACAESAEGPRSRSSRGGAGAAAVGGGRGSGGATAVGTTQEDEGAAAAAGGGRTDESGRTPASHLLESGEEAEVGPSSRSTGTSSSSGEERSAAAAQTRADMETAIGQAQSTKKQTDRAGATSQTPPDSGAKAAATPPSAAAAAVGGGGGAAAAGGGGGGRGAVATRGATGAAQQQQQTNGGAGYAAELPEDPELVERLKQLLAALPRKKDAEARWLLSGEMQFVRPYALQIVDVWKIHLGEAGRTALKKDISERTQADATLKRRVLAISKLKMATLEELVQIAELADLLVRTLRIANMYEAERQVASVTRQSASRRALNAGVSAAIPSPSLPVGSHYAAASGTTTSDASSPAAGAAVAGGSSSSFCASGLTSSGSGRSASTPAQSGMTTRHNSASYSPSRASLAPSVSPPADASPQGHRLEGAVSSPRSRSACSTSAQLSPRGSGGGGSGAAGLAAAAAPEESPVASEERSSRFLLKSPPPGEGTCTSSGSSNSPTPLYDHPLDKSSCQRAAAAAAAAANGAAAPSLAVAAGSALSERNSGAAKTTSPRSSSELKYNLTGVSEGVEDNSGSVVQQRLQHQHLQQLQQQQEQLHHGQQQQQQLDSGHQQSTSFAGSSDEDVRCSEAEVSLVAQELRETLNILQQSGARMQQRGKEPLSRFVSTAEDVHIRGGGVSPSKDDWTVQTEKAEVLSDVQQRQQGEYTKKKVMLPQPRRSQQQSLEYGDKDEEAMRTAELLAAFADLRPSIGSGSQSQQGATDISSSSTMAHEELLNFTLEAAAAAGVAASPRARALVAALSDSRLARMLELPGLAGLEKGESGGTKRRPQDQELMTLLRVAALSGDEAAATALAGRLLGLPSQGTTSNSSSSSEAEGAAAQEVDGVGPAGHQPVRRKRVRRSGKAAVRNGSRVRSAASINSRDLRLDESDTMLLQQLHQQLQQLQQQQLLRGGGREGSEEDLSAALAGEVQACMNALEAEAAAGKADLLSQGGGEKVYSKRKRNHQPTLDGKPHARDTTRDEETEEEDSSSRTRGRGQDANSTMSSETAALLRSVERHNRRDTSLEGDSSSTAAAAAAGLPGEAACKSTQASPPREDESESQAKSCSVRRSAPFSGEREGVSGAAATEARSGSSKGACVRVPRSRKEEEEEEEENGGNSNGSLRCSTERGGMTPADGSEERAADGATGSGGGAHRPPSRSDTDVDVRSNATSRSVSRSGTHRGNSAADTYAGTSAENSSSYGRGRNGVRQGKDNLWAAAPYATRRSAAVAAGTGAGEGLDACFAEVGRISSSNNSRTSTRGGGVPTQSDSEGKIPMIEKTETDAGSVSAPGDSVAEQCAREAKQLLERALRVNDALGFLPASCRLAGGGAPRDQETSSTASNSGTGTRAKRAREQVSAGDWDSGALLQVLATVCLMSLKR